MQTHRHVIHKSVQALVEAGKSVPDPVTSQKQIVNGAVQWLIDTQQPKRKRQSDWRKDHPDIILTESEP